MANIVAGTTGPQNLPDGATPKQGNRIGKYGDLIVSAGHANYFETVSRGNVWSATGGAVTPAAYSTGFTGAFTGFMLSNPVGNNKIVTPLWISNVMGAAQTAVNLWMVMVGHNDTANVTHTTPITNIVNNLGYVTLQPTAKADTGATAPSPTYWVQSIFNSPTTTLMPTPPIFEMKGMIVLPPGSWMAVGCVQAVGGTYSINVTWEELPA